MKMLHATTRGLVVALIVASCAHEPTTPTIVPPDPAAVAESILVRDSFYPVTIPTFEGSGQLTETSAIRFDSTWNGWRYWIAFVPAPRGSSVYEQPSVAVSQNGRVWRVPPGGVNPIDTAAALSDPTIAFDSVTHTMRLYYRYSLTADRIRLVASADGITWSTQGDVLTGGWGSLVQPAIVRGPVDWELWTVNANLANARYPYYACAATATQLERRHSSNGLSFGPPDTVLLIQPGYLLWHVDVRYARGRYWALSAAYPVGSDCDHTVNFLASSVDGLTWSVPGAPLATGVFTGLVYKSAIVVRDSTARLWLNGADAHGDWRTFLQEIAAP